MLCFNFILIFFGKFFCFKFFWKSVLGLVFIYFKFVIYKRLIKINDLNIDCDIF